MIALPVAAGPAMTGSLLQQLLFYPLHRQSEILTLQPI